MIRYRLWVWVLCLVFPTWVWAENETRTCTSFTQQGRQVTFHLADSAALQLQLLQPFRGKNLVLAGREAATEKRFLCRDQ